MSWLPVSVTVEPTAEPVTIAEARAQCRVDGTDSDGLLNSYIKAARQMAEGDTWTKLVTQTVSMKCAAWCDLKIFPVAPVQSITSIKYLDTSGAEQTLATSVYEVVLDGLRPRVRLKPGQTWPATFAADDAIRVVAVVGYTTVPEPIRAAMLLTIESLYDDRSEGRLTDAARSCLTTYRRF